MEQASLKDTCSENAKFKLQESSYITHKKRILPGGIEEALSLL